MPEPLTPEEVSGLSVGGAGWCSEEMFDRLIATCQAAWQERDEAIRRLDVEGHLVADLMVERNAAMKAANHDALRSTMFQGDADLLRGQLRDAREDGLKAAAIYEECILDWQAEGTRLRAEVERLRVALRADDERLLKAASVAGIPYHGCDTPDLLAEEVERLRAVVEAARVLWRAGQDSFTPAEWTVLARALAALEVPANA